MSYYVSESGAEAGRSDSKLAVLALCRTGSGYLGLKDLLSRETARGQEGHLEADGGPCQASFRTHHVPLLLNPSS